MKAFTRQYKIGFSLYGLVAFLLQELPYLPWLAWPPADNPLAGNNPTNLLSGLLEQAGGVLTIVLLVLVTRREHNHPTIKNTAFGLAALCLAIYYISWACYFAGITNAWLIVLGLSAVVPLYYLFVAIWLKNPLAAFTSVLFLVGHTGSNTVNYLLS